MTSPDFPAASDTLPEKPLCTGLRSRWRGYNSFTMSAQISSLVVGTLSAFRLIGWIFLALAVAGTISSTIFLGLALAGAWRYLRASRHVEATQDSNLPPVSVLKPVHGFEPALRENLGSFFCQEYPDYEILIAAAEENDAALPVVREVCARYPQIRSKVLVTGTPPWPNPPAYAFYRMTAISQHDILVTSDSDVRVSPNYLREVVAPLLDKKNGLVTCLYRGKSLGGFWSALDAIGMSVEMTAGVLVANLLEGMKFALGPTIAARKDALAKIGGYPAVGDYFSNDFAIGSLVAKAGYRVILSRHVIDHVVPPMSFRRMWERQVRWAKGTRYSRPKGHFGTGLIFAMPYGILGFASATLLGLPGLALLLLGAALLNRLIECWVIGWKVVRDPQARRAVWLCPVRDIFGFLVWCASYLSPRTVWRDSQYELLEGGRIVRRERSTNE
jgi:ceramide glucosyltransferase